MEMLEMYVASVLRKIRVIRIYSKSLRGCMQIWLDGRAPTDSRPSSNIRATKGFAYSDRYAYVGEPESSDPPVHATTFSSLLLLIRPPIQISS